MKDYCQNAVLLTGAHSPIGSCIINCLKRNHLIVRGVRKKGSPVPVVVDKDPLDVPIWEHDLNLIENIEESLNDFLENHRIRIAQFIHAAGVVPIVATRAINPSDLTYAMNVNYSSAALIVKALLGRWNRSFLKNVIFLSSVSAHRGIRGFGTYASSKAALESLARTLAVELAPHVRVNALAIGAIDTGHLSQPAIEALVPQHPLGLGKPEDIASAVEYFISENARWVTGQVFQIDGGYLTRS